MDDKKVAELKALELSYQRQLMYMKMMISVGLIGVVLYIINIYRYDVQLFLISVMLVAVSIIILMSMDTKLKEISKKIRK
ncbi:MAG TPA: hypothetical protein VEC16_03055 [Alphaproteobacteria bacterium]|nr:hypothetical protein [Alphaproteobacteria bacterium]